MFFKIVKRTFWTWWDNLSFSMLSSFLGGLNPFYIIFLGTFTYIVEDFSLVVDFKEFFLLLFGGVLPAIHVFPTTIAAYSVQKRLIDKKSVKYFSEYWQDLKKYFGKGLVLTLICLLAGLLLAYSVLFYQQQLSGLLSMILTVISSVFFIILMFMQLIIVPLVIEDDYPVKDYFLISVSMIFKKPLLLIPVLIFESLLLLLSFIPALSPVLVIIPLVAYLGLVSIFRIWLFRYLDDAPEIHKELGERSAGELFSPITTLFKSKKKVDEEGENEKKE